MGSKVLEVMVEYDVLMGVLEYIHIYIRLEIQRIEEMRFYVFCVFACLR